MDCTVDCGCYGAIVRAQHATVSTKETAQALLVGHGTSWFEFFFPLFNHACPAWILLLVISHVLAVAMFCS